MNTAKWSELCRGPGVESRKKNKLIRAKIYERLYMGLG